MAEPATHAAASAASVITVSGLATGLPADLILPAFVGALWSLRAAKQSGLVMRVWQVATGTLGAAWGSQAAAAALIGFMPTVAGAPNIKYFVAFGMGFSLLRLLDAWTRRKEEEGARP